MKGRNGVGWVIDPPSRKVRRGRTGRSGGRWIPSRWFAGVCIGLGLTAGAGRTHADDPGASALHARIERLQDRVEQLAGTGSALGGLDTLHFGWFDRPYARATLAILVKTTTVLQREARLRDRDNGAIPDETVRAMLTWTDDALARVIGAKPDPKFRPHRLRVDAADLWASRRPAPGGATSLPPLFGFVDRATSTRHHHAFGDLDLMAAMGLRVYPRFRRDLRDPEANDVLSRRAGELGMAVLKIGPVRDGESSVTTVTLRSLLETPSRVISAPGVILALTDPQGGESWPASLARRAVARGTLGRQRSVVVDLRAPSSTAGRDRPPGAIAAAMWVHAIEGTSLGLLPGWRDLRDGSGSPHPSVFVDPLGIETVTHTALDLMRYAAHLQALKTPPAMAIAVSGDAIDADDDNAWAGWIEPVFEALVARQIPFDVGRLGVVDGELRARYRLVFPVRPVGGDEVSSVIARIEQAVTERGERPGRVTAHEPDGRLAADLFVRATPAPGAKACVAVVNLSAHPRRIKLRRTLVLPLLYDLITHQRLDPREALITFDPWQLRLLVE